MKSDKINVVYIGGLGRSGSTLIDMIMGQADGFFSAGELRWIWQRSFLKNELVSTQQPFRESAFWQKVVADAFGSFDEIDAEYVESLRAKVDRLRYIPQMLTGLYLENYQKQLQEYQQYLSALYKAIQKQTNCRYIIDSSKDSPHAYILNSMDDIDLYMAHLVRDSRAVAHSWQRKKVRPEVHWKKEYMVNFSLWWCARRWTYENFLISLMSTRNKQYARIRYEDFVENPQEQLNVYWDMLNEPHHSVEELISKLQTGQKEIHSVSGNPIRFQQKEIKIRPDYEWKEKMPVNQKMYMTMLTFPLLLNYNYLL